MATKNLIRFPQQPKGQSKLAEKIGFFTTARGIHFSSKVMAFASIGIGAACATFESTFLHRYIDFVRAYRNGMPVEVPEELEVMVDTASDLAKLEPRQTVNLKTFIVSGFDVNAVGSVNSSYYGWVGIPLNFFYNSNQDIDRFNLKLRNEPINWNSKHGEMLEKALILTDDEKQFGITKAVMELRNYNYIHRGAIPGLTVFGLYCSTQYINRRFGLFHIPRAGRVMIYGLLTTFAYGLYSIVTDTIKIQQTSSVDAKLAELGADMIEAGIRFYEKLLNKNIAMRELSGKDLYSAKGNEYPGILRMNVYPLTARKNFFENALEELRKKEANAKMATTEASQGKTTANSSDKTK